ncbi:MAG: CoA-binding protein [Chloroflexi bacterium]|nr:CoA-binding protein [Chloroflexota bacterium]
MPNEQMIKIMAETKTIAVVGMSRRSFRPAHYVPEYLQQQGYRIIPVNPFLKGEALGEKAYDALSEIPDPVDLALIFQRSENVPPFVDEAIRIGIRAVWMQLGIANADAAARASAAGLDVVENACLMVEHRKWAGR